MDLIKIKRSRESVNRLIKLFLGLNETPYFFHQTLTFRQNIKDGNEAKIYLKRLFDSLGLVFPQMGAIFVQEYQRRWGLHFHVIFIIFEKQADSPEQMREILGREVFSRWNKLNGGSLVRQANRITLQKNDIQTIDYLLKGVIPTGKELKRETLWHGVRNRSMLKANSSPVSNDQIKKVFGKVFPKRKSISFVRTSPFTMRNLQAEKQYLEVAHNGDWEIFKKQVLKTKDKVSDAAYIKFKNKGRDETIFNKGKIKSNLKDELWF